MVAAQNIASTSGLTLSMLSSSARQWAPPAHRLVAQSTRSTVTAKRLLMTTTSSSRGSLALCSSRPSLRAPRIPTISSLLPYRAPIGSPRALSLLSKKPETPEEPDVYIDGPDPQLNLTDRAIDHLTRVAQRESNDSLGLRILVEPGGCHGYQYKMELVSAVQDVEEDDFVFAYPQAKAQADADEKVFLVVDSVSLRLIKGSTIDYVTELIGSQFSILDNPQAKGAGCGCGVSWEPNF